MTTTAAIIREFAAVKANRAEAFEQTEFCIEGLQERLVNVVNSAAIWASSPRSVHVRGTIGPDTYILAELLDHAAGNAGMTTGIITTDDAAGLATLSW